MSGIEPFDRDRADGIQNCLIEYERIVAMADDDCIIHPYMNGVIAITDRYGAVRTSSDRIVAIASGYVASVSGDNRVVAITGGDVGGSWAGAPAGKTM